MAVNGSDVYIGNGLNGLYLWGAQLEKGNTAGSYFNSYSSAFQDNFQPDMSLHTAPNYNHPNTLYVTSIVSDGVNRLGILIRESDDGGATWPIATNMSSNKRIFIPSAGADYPQAVVDGNDNIYVYWTTGQAPFYWAVIHHTTDGNFNLIQPPPGDIHTKGPSDPTWYWVDRLFCDPTTNRIYAVGTTVTTPAVNPVTADVFVTRLDPGKEFKSPYYILVRLNILRGYYSGVSYLPGIRENGSFVNISGGVNAKILYIGWHEPQNPTTLGVPNVLNLRRVFDDLNGIDTGFTLDSTWTFNGGTAWNIPYRVDVCVGQNVNNPNVNIVGMVFYGAYSSTLDINNVTRTNRRIVTTTDDGLSGWDDTQLSLTHPNWRWASNAAHLEWYRAYMDPTTNWIYTTWNEDQVAYNGQTLDNQTFYNMIYPAGY
jgi:hypothetical protein